MTASEAIKELDAMQRQIIHGPTVFREIADVIRNLQEDYERQYSAGNILHSRLQWMIERKAIVYETTRMTTRRGGLERENMEKVWTCDFEGLDGSDIMLGVDAGHKTSGDAIDAAMAFDK